MTDTSRLPWRKRLGTMTAIQASNAMAALREGKTLRRICGGMVGRRYVRGEKIADYTAFHNYCRDQPEFARDALPLLAANMKAADYLKGQPRRAQTRCINGHLFSSTRNDGKCIRRECAACEKLSGQRGGIIKPDVLKKVTALLQAGAPISSFTAGGKKGYLVRHCTLSRYRRENAKFDRFVIDATKDNNSRGQKQRFQLQRMVTGCRVEQANDFHSIKAMIPLYLPDYVRDDIVQSVFVALLERTLRIDDVRKRIGDFVAAHDRMFPTKYATFAGRPLVSLDARLFDDGTTTLGDTVTRSLWD